MPNWILEQSKEFAIEYQQIHGKPPIGMVKTYDTDEYVYKVKFHHNQRGEVDRTISRRRKGSPILEALAVLIHFLARFLRWFVHLLWRGASRLSLTSGGLGNRAHCPNCDRSRRRYDTDKFLKCHTCGWVIGLPLLRWLRYPTWLQYYWEQLKDRRGSKWLGTLLGLPFWPLRMLDPKWWRILPYKRQHTLLLGFFLGFLLALLVFEPGYIQSATNTLWNTISGN